MEVRDIEMFDAPGSFLHLYMTKDKRVVMKLQREFFDIMCGVNPQFLPNLCFTKMGIRFYTYYYHEIYMDSYSQLCSGMTYMR